MADWLTTVIRLIQLVPATFSLIEKIVGVIKAHPDGGAAGVESVSNHMDDMAVEETLKSNKL